MGQDFHVNSDNHENRARPLARFLFTGFQDEQDCMLIRCSYKSRTVIFG